nr:MAG TPA: hypothetical protein [Caudoviricetes sp.]
MRLGLQGQPRRPRKTAPTRRTAAGGCKFSKAQIPEYLT